MSYADVCEAVESLQRKYCEPNPFRLCADMGIKLLYQPLGTDPDAIKGFYLESKRIRTITVNCDLPTVIQRIIVSHELGHGVYEFLGEAGPEAVSYRHLRAHET